MQGGEPLDFKFGETPLAHCLPLSPEPLADQLLKRWVLLKWFRRFMWCASSSLSQISLIVTHYTGMFLCSWMALVSGMSTCPVSSSSFANPNILGFLYTIVGTVIHVFVSLPHHGGCILAVEILGINWQKHACPSSIPCMFF